MVEGNLACLVELAVASAAVDERLTELGLEALHGAAECGLRDTEFRGCGADGTCAVDGVELPELFDIREKLLSFMRLVHMISRNRHCTFDVPARKLKAVKHAPALPP